MPLDKQCKYSKCFLVEKELFSNETEIIPQQFEYKFEGEKVVPPLSTSSIEKHRYCELVWKIELIRVDHWEYCPTHNEEIVRKQKFAKSA